MAKVWCNNRGCKYSSCVKQITNAPYNEKILVNTYESKKSGQCLSYLATWEKHLLTYNTENNGQMKLDL